MKLVRRHTFVAALLCFVSLLAYWGTLGSGFVWDDNFQIVRNPYLHADYPVTKLLFSDVWGYTRGSQTSTSNYYRPLQMLTYRLTYGAAGLNPAVFHGVNLFLNCLAAIAVYWLLLELTKRQALALTAALLFSVHPIHSEAVIWIAALTELGCALFYFVAFALFLRSENAREVTVPETRSKTKKPAKVLPDAASTHRKWWLAGAVAAFACSLLWKEMALTFPLIVAAYVWLTSTATNWRRRAADAALRSLPFWGVIAAYIPLRIGVLGYFSKVQHQWSLTPVQFVTNTMVLTSEYFWRMLLPIRLNAFHVFHPVRSISDARLVVAFLFLLCLGAGILFFARRRPLPTFAAVWALITLVPVLNVQGVGENVFAERYLFIPSLGLILLVAWSAAELLRRLAPQTMKIVAAAAVCLIATASIAEIRARVPDWRSDLALYESTLRLSPDAALVHNSLGQIWLDGGEFDAAEREYTAALRSAEAQQNPTQVASAYLGLASTAWHRGNSERGLQLANAGLKIAPDLASLQIARGILLLQLGRMAESKAELERAVRLSPYDEVVLNALGAIAIAEKNYDAALDYFQRCVSVVPNFASGYNNMGRTYLEMGRLPDAVPRFKRAVELEPDNPTFLTNYGIALSRSGDMANARLALERAIAVDPNNPSARAELSRLTPHP
jgi:protein O-mannosyl-transferase